LFAIELSPFYLRPGFAWRLVYPRGLQLLILLTGNYAFFLAHHCPLPATLDDTFLQRCLLNDNSQISESHPASPEKMGRRSSGWDRFFSLFYPLDPKNPRPNILVRVQQFLLLALAIVIFLLSSAHVTRLFIPLPLPVRQAMSGWHRFAASTVTAFFRHDTTRPDHYRRQQRRPNMAGV
jgi:hypothetical protein